MDTDILPPSTPFSPELRDILIVLGVILAVALIAFFWVVLFHKDGKRRRKHHHHHHHREDYSEQFRKSAGEIKELIRQRRRGRHREHRPINPTLAQTGGLPPRREADEPPPPP
jgi:FtsZ-interacting cell division protein ZipA